MLSFWVFLFIFLDFRVFFFFFFGYFFLVLFNVSFFPPSKAHDCTGATEMMINELKLIKLNRGG